MRKIYWVCDKCKRGIESMEETKRTEEDNYPVLLECPHCEQEAHFFFISNELERKVRGAAQE